MNYSMEAREILYTEPAGEMAVEVLRHKNVNNYRTKTYKAGEQVEIYCFPILNHLLDVKEANRAMEKAKSTEAQRRLNEKNSFRLLERKANANFGYGDLLMTNTYWPEEQPGSDDEAQRDIRNFIGRLSYMWGRKGLEEFKYIYVTEKTEGKNGTKYHHHIILSGNGVTREEVEEKWPYGNANTRRYQWQPEGFAGFAHYMVKKKTDREKPQEKAMKRRWACSKNLKNPEPTVADKKISRRQAKVIALAAETQAAAIFEKAYPGYVLTSCEVHWSKFAPGAYIYARMRKVTEREGKRTSRAARSRRANGAVSVGTGKHGALS